MVTSTLIISAVFLIMHLNKYSLINASVLSRTKIFFTQIGHTWKSSLRKIGYSLLSLANLILILFCTVSNKTSKIYKKNYNTMQEEVKSYMSKEQTRWY